MCLLSVVPRQGTHCQEYRFSTTVFLKQGISLCSPLVHSHYFLRHAFHAACWATATSVIAVWFSKSLEIQPSRDRRYACEAPRHGERPHSSDCAMCAWGHCDPFLPPPLLRLTNWEHWQRSKLYVNCDRGINFVLILKLLSRSQSSYICDFSQRSFPLNARYVFKFILVILWQHTLCLLGLFLAAPHHKPSNTKP